MKILNFLSFMACCYLMGVGLADVIKSSPVIGLAFTAALILFLCGGSHENS